MDRLIDLLHAFLSRERPDGFEDQDILEAMLETEGALARVEGRLGLIPETAAAPIARAADPLHFDVQALGAALPVSGTVVIPLVRALSEQTRMLDPDAAGFVHWGATSQDIADTAVSLCLTRVHADLARTHERLVTGLRDLSERHATTILLGRTLLQPAPPVTFGLKAAGWYAGCTRAWSHLAATARAAYVLQFGGAAGTLASLGEDGPRVAEALAADLGLPCPEAPWHAHRDRLASAMAAHGVYVGTLGKIARDISLLMQFEVGEVSEPGGGSSTMPHKRNPSGCAAVLSAATRVPGLVATMLSAMPQEHERGVGGLHAEWPTVVAIVRATRAAQRAMADVIDGLEVDEDRMRRNLDATGGAIFAERVMMRLGAAIGRDAAYELVSRAYAESRTSGRAFLDVMIATPGITAHVTAGDLADLLRPEAYLGAAETLRQRLLATPAS